MENKVPLLKLLTRVGFMSRRKIVIAIQQGYIAVNGSKIEDFSFPVDPNQDVITFKGKPVNLIIEPKVYLMFNKPVGILSTTKDYKGSKTAIDLLPEKYRRIRIYPAGRLDKDSSGLLLLSNDGDLVYKLTHPKYEHEKEYIVKVTKRLTWKEIKHLERGIALEDGLTYPAKIRELPALQSNCYSITIHEGRKRQIRRMFYAIGYRVVELHRIRIGTLELGKLKKGNLRELSSKEIKHLKQSII